MGWSGTVPGEFWNAWVHPVPWLRAFDPNIRFRCEPARIIEACSLYSDKLRSRQTRGEQRRATDATKFALRNIPALGHDSMLAALAAQQAHRIRRHDQRCRVAAAAGALAVATVTIDHAQWERRAFVANCAAGTSAAER